ncbi:MAG: hypothetical protein Q9217_004334 [Psora testacea]
MNTPEEDLDTTTSLESLQTKEQREVLDIVAQLQKCGLESVLSLPQLVVCGEQSAGKSSVLEALTEIPFPRNDNLCTRFAAEIILHRASSNSFTIKVIPEPDRPASEQESIKLFAESIISFDELPRVMGEAMVVMGIDDSAKSDSSTRAFARDVLSIEIEGPSRPQLTLVDLPGIIENDTKDATKEDVKLVKAITHHYISQPRTICLAVVAGTSDYANQGILTRPLQLQEPSSRNWGIDALRTRLSRLLFSHVKSELPKLREDLEKALTESKGQLDVLGNPRAMSHECKTYLAQLSLDFHEVCKAAIGGHYEGDYFNSAIDPTFSPTSTATVRRLRAVIQFMNTDFSNHLRTNGHKYQIDTSGHAVAAIDDDWISPQGHRSSEKVILPKSQAGSPARMSNALALKWVGQALMRTRGRELGGNFNPLLVGELFWEQSSSWHLLAKSHVDAVAQTCRRFLLNLLQEMCPEDVCSRLWSSQIQDGLKERSVSATRELELLMEDIKSYPINYNHYYTDTIKKRRRDRDKEALSECLQQSTTDTPLPGCHSTHSSTKIDVDRAIDQYCSRADPEMEKHSCEEALDCLFSIYKVSQKTFIANITTQVIERHIVRGLEKIFSPVTVNNLSESESQAIASEPSLAKRHREFLEDRIGKLTDGHQVLRDVTSIAES